MRIAHFFIDHPRFAAVINIFIVVFGLATMVILPIAQYPNIVPPTIQVTTTYPGASAEVVAHCRHATRTIHQWCRGHGLHQQSVDG